MYYCERCQLKMSDTSKFEKEKKDYLRRLHTEAPTTSTPGLLSEGEEKGLKELFPQYFEDFIAVEQIARGTYKRTIQLRNPETGELVAFKTVDLDSLNENERAKQNLKKRKRKYYTDPVIAFEDESKRMEKAL